MRETNYIHISFANVYRANARLSERATLPQFSLSDEKQGAGLRTRNVLSSFVLKNIVAPRFFFLGFFHHKRCYYQRNREIDAMRRLLRGHDTWGVLRNNHGETTVSLSLSLSFFLSFSFSPHFCYFVFIFGFGVNLFLHVLPINLILCLCIYFHKSISDFYCFHLFFFFLNRN